MLNVMMITEQSGNILMYYLDPCLWEWRKTTNKPLR